MVKMREARFWPKMMFEPIFFQALWQFFVPLLAELWDNA